MNKHKCDKVNNEVVMLFASSFAKTQEALKERYVVDLLKNHLSSRSAKMSMKKQFEMSLPALKEMLKATKEAVFEDAVNKEMNSLLLRGGLDYVKLLDSLCNTNYAEELYNCFRYGAVRTCHYA